MLQAHLPHVKDEAAQAGADLADGETAAAAASTAEPSEPVDDDAALHPADAGPAQATEQPPEGEAVTGGHSERCSPAGAELVAQHDAEAAPVPTQEAGENLLPPLALPSPKQAMASHALSSLSSPLGDISNHNSPTPSPHPQRQPGALGAAQFATPASQQHAAFPSPLAGFPTPLTVPALASQQQIESYVQVCVPIIIWC